MFLRVKLVGTFFFFVLFLLLIYFFIVYYQGCSFNGGYRWVMFGNSLNLVYMQILVLYFEFFFRLQVVIVNWIIYFKVGVILLVFGFQVFCLFFLRGGICYRNRFSRFFSDLLFCLCFFVCVVLGICKGEKVRLKVMKKVGCYGGCEVVERWRQWRAQFLEDRVSVLRFRVIGEFFWVVVFLFEG